MLQGSLERSTAGDLRKKGKKKRQTESVYIQQKQTEHGFWTGLWQNALQPDKVKQCQHIASIVVEVMLSAEVSLLSFYSCFSATRAPPTPDHTLQWQRQFDCFPQTWRNTVFIVNCYPVNLPTDNLPGAPASSYKMTAQHVEGDINAP